MSTLQLWMLSGALVGAGLASLVWWLVPAHPDPVQALERISPPVRRIPVPEARTDGDRSRLESRLGLWAMRRLPSRLWANAPRRDLALMGKPLHVFYGEKVVFVATACCIARRNAAACCLGISPVWTFSAEAIRWPICSIGWLKTISSYLPATVSHSRCAD